METVRNPAEAEAVKGDEALPVPLGSQLVVAPAFREGEAVVHAGVDLELAGRAGSLEVAAELLDHVEGGDLVVLGAYAGDAVEVRAMHAASR